MFPDRTQERVIEMKEPENVFEALNMLRKQNGKPVQNFRSISGYLGLKAREKGVPVNNQFELTPLCNFDCKMCYVHLNPEQMKGHSLLPVSTWKELMYQSWQEGMISATLSGGECLTYPGFDDLFLYLHSLGCEVNILTNGFLLDEKRIRFFQEHKPGRIQITLYGSNDDVYERVTGQRAFNTVAENIKKAIDAGLPVSLNVTPNRYLGDAVIETIKTAQKMCSAVTVNSALFSPREETGRSEQQDDLETELYIKIYRLMRELNGLEIKEIKLSDLPPAGGKRQECDQCGLRCGAGRSGFVMDWKGTMMPCNRMEMSKAYPLKEGIKASWASINLACNQWPRVQECEECAYRDVCNNCAGNMLRYAGPGKQPVKLCERTRLLVSKGVRSLLECE